MSITLASLVALVLILPLAALSDRIGRRPMLIAGIGGFDVLAYPLFLLLNSGSLAAAMTAHCALAAIEAVYVSAAVTAGVELFATRVRYSGFSVGYNIAVAGIRRHDAVRRDLARPARTGNVMAPAFYLMSRRPPFVGHRPRPARDRGAGPAWLPWMLTHGCHGRRPTKADVARLAKVSAATVSYVLEQR